ncbi:hypothetical protein SAMN04487970_101156 [Paenibacillus tianmuensis]|uniref:DUF3299 domain-containing protein n=1 Tax=Paenibacillus tianmuensis TaxID=624147 RepID=A0A1G4R2G3_9BACL|nr:hypothetical protein [Paenibacillus tianmuensis]SCW50898.1 hypothetical protein SAMN04487970_101156 [Paenibacillus tianmuensis]
MRLEPRGMTALTASLIAVMLLVPGCNQPVPLSSGGPVDSSVSAAASAPAVETSAAGTQLNQADAVAGSQTAATSTEEADKAAQPVAADAGQAGGGQTAAGSPSAGAAGSAAAAPGAAGNAPASTAPAGDAATGSATADAAAKGAPAAAGTKPAQEKPPAAEQAASKQAKPAVTKNIVKEAGKTPVLTFEDLYAEMTVRGVKLSDKVNQLAGRKVEMTGFMAPPLTAKVNFFVLTKVALTVCPFCSTDADWPTDIVVVFMPKGKDVTPTEHQVKVTGTLSVGSQTDEETGFVSLIRINADNVEVLK